MSAHGTRLFAALLALAAPSDAAEPHEDLAPEVKPYRIELGGLPKTMTPGQTADLELDVLPVEPLAYLDPSRPVRVELATGGGLRVRPHSLTEKDARWVERSGIRLAATATALYQGPARLSAAIAFYICTEAGCEPAKETLTRYVMVQSVGR